MRNPTPSPPSTTKWIDWSTINWIDLIFINFICVITILGTLLNFIEPWLPAIVRQTFRYGKHAYKGAPSRLAQLAELPKSYFRHFYVFALIWSSAWMYLALHVYVGKWQAPESVLWLLDTLCGSQRQARTNPTITLIAIGLLFVQCVRRFYETHFVQIFSASSRMNITHYIVGYFHYFGAFLAIVSQAHGFVRPKSSSAMDLSGDVDLALRDCGLLQWLAVAVFAYAWNQQFVANLTLADLRCDRDGTVVTQKHLLPRGGYFELVSAPHMFFEIVLYMAVYVIIHANSSWLFVMCWVLTNQLENAWLTHKWYLANFVDYPTQRRAIFPMLL